MPKKKPRGWGNMCAISVSKYGFSLCLYMCLPSQFIYLKNIFHLYSRNKLWITGIKDVFLHQELHCKFRMYCKSSWNIFTSCFWYNFFSSVPSLTLDTSSSGGRPTILTTSIVPLVGKGKHYQYPGFYFHVTELVKDWCWFKLLFAQVIFLWFSNFLYVYCILNV